MAKAFIDTNIHVYAYDTRDPAKQQRAADLVAELIDTHAAVISTQVLQEFASSAFAKLGQTPEQVHYHVALLAALQVVPVTPGLIHRAIDIKTRYQINYWDACILAAAESAGCDVLYSEDLNPGQSYAGVRVVNPFAA